MFLLLTLNNVSKEAVAPDWDFQIQRIFPIDKLLQEISLLLVHLNKCSGFEATYFLFSGLRTFLTNVGGRNKNKNKIHLSNFFSRFRISDVGG